MKKRSGLLALLMLSLAPALALAAEGGDKPGEAFWQALQKLCGKSFQGQLLNPQARDADMAGKQLLMQVRSCSENEIRVPFHVGEDHSRTWVFTRSSEGLRLKHDHRHADGSEDAITQYGGDSRGPVSGSSVEFFADAHTAALIPGAASNVWTVTVDDKSYVYALRREGSDRRFQVVFDLRQNVPAPPAPWGQK